MAHRYWPVYGPISLDGLKTKSIRRSTEATQAPPQEAPPQAPAETAAETPKSHMGLWIGLGAGALLLGALLIGNRRR